MTCFKQTLLTFVCLATFTPGLPGETTVYRDDFDGPEPLPLNGQAPDVRPGREVWSVFERMARNPTDPRADGTFPGGARRTANLPVELEPGNVYTFTANLRIANPDRDSEDFGGISINETPTTGTHLQSDIAFLAIRRNGGAQATTAGEARTIDIPAGTYAVDRSEGQELAIAIDTSDEDWTVMYEIDGDVVGRRDLPSRDLGTYYLNIGQYDSANVVFEFIALVRSRS